MTMFIQCKREKLHMDRKRDGDWCHLCNGLSNDLVGFDCAKGSNRFDKGKSRYLRICRSCVSQMAEILKL